MVIPRFVTFMWLSSFSVALLAWRLVYASLRCGNRWLRSDRRKQIIRTHFLSETSSDYIGLVRSMGLEPIRLLTHAPQTCLSAYSSTTANNNNYNTLPSSFCQSLFGKIYIHFCRSFSGGYFRRTTEPLCRCRFLRHAKKTRAEGKKSFPSAADSYLSVSLRKRSAGFTDPAYRVRDCRSEA